MSDLVGTSPDGGYLVQMDDGSQHSLPLGALPDDLQAKAALMSKAEAGPATEDDAPDFRLRNAGKAIGSAAGAAGNFLGDVGSAIGRYAQGKPMSPAIESTDASTGSGGSPGGIPGALQSMASGSGGKASPNDFQFHGEGQKKPGETAPIVPASTPGGGGGGGAASEFKQGQEIGKSAIGMQGTIDQQVAEEQAPVAKANAEATAKLIQDNQAYQQQVQIKTKENLDRMSQVTEDFLSQKVNPNQWWENKSTVGKILAASSMLVGGFFDGLAGKPNQALGVVLGFINKDIEQQRQDIEQKKAGTGMLKDLVDGYRSAGASASQAMAHGVVALQEKAKADMLNIASQHGGEQAAATMATKLGDFGMSSAQNQQKLASEASATATSAVQRQSASYGLAREKAIDQQFGVHPAGYSAVPGYGWAPEKVAEKATDANIGFEQVKSALNEYKRTLQKGTEAQRLAAAATAKGAAAKYMGVVKAAGASDENSSAVAELANPTYWDTLARRGHSVEKIDEAMKSFSGQHKSALKAMGMLPSIREEERK